MRRRPSAIRRVAICDSGAFRDADHAEVPRLLRRPRPECRKIDTCGDSGAVPETFRTKSLTSFVATSEAPFGSGADAPWSQPRFS